MNTSHHTLVLVDAQPAKPAVVLPGGVCLSFLRQADRIHRAGLKSFGLFVADPALPDYPYAATDAVFLDPHRNRRNDPSNRPAFHAQGEYFRRYDDAGFVADPADLIQAYRRIDDAGLQVTGMFHSHRRQPPNFSVIDYRLHNPTFAWHLILSYHQGSRPQLRPYRIDKTDLDMGISEHDDNQASERAYEGPEVSPLGLILHGPTEVLAACLDAVDRRPGATSGKPLAMLGR
jgi:proteasome lid subunit RPN8/RPN11